MCDEQKINERGALRWEPYEGEEDDEHAKGDIVTGEPGCFGYEVIAQCVSRQMGTMICKDVNARDALLSSCDELLANLCAKKCGSPHCDYCSPNSIGSRAKAAIEMAKYEGVSQ